MTVFNASVGSTELLVATGIGVFLGTSEARTIMAVGYGPKGFKKLDLTSKVGESLVRAAPPAVGAV